VALHETRVFLDRLIRLPGIRLVGTPALRWCDELGSYELRDAIVACDRPRSARPVSAEPFSRLIAFQQKGHRVS
jgi:hypothetical protein